MDIEDIRTFVEVADAGGVTAAALRLGISKSMVSRRLVRLEAELGVQLLARSTRGASLTEEGATFRDYAARISAEIDVARETILPAGEPPWPPADCCAAFLRPNAFRAGDCADGAPSSSTPDTDLLH